MKRIIALLSLCCVLAFVVAVRFFTNDGDAIMVDGVVYYSTGQEIPAEFDESAIQEVVSYTDGVPAENGQTNFGPDLKPDMPDTKKILPFW